MKAFPQSPQRKKKSRAAYSKGEINKLIDTMLHPYFNRHPTLVIVDAALHGFVEQNPSETVLKFIRYNLPKIIDEITASHRI